MNGIKYEIPEVPATLNRYVGRNNIWEYTDQKKLWRGLCEIYCRPKPDKPLDGVTVRLTYVFTDNRRRDVDNLIKPVLDGLTAAGIIRDDCWQCITIEARGELGNERKTIVEIR